MGEFSAKTTNKDLIQIDASIPEDALPDLEKLLSRGASSEISALFRAKSFISIGEPLVFPLTELGSPISTEIRMQMSRYEFYRVHLSCSFEAATGCRFFDARFEVDLKTFRTGHNFPSIPDEAAIAYDLYPQKLEDTLKLNRKYSLGSDLNFNFGVVSTKFPVSQEQSEEYISYNSWIIASGLRTNTPVWRFIRNEAHEIEGSQELFALIRKPKYSQVRAKFSLAARLEVMTKMGPFGPFPLTFYRRGSTDPLISDEPIVPLC